MVLTLNTTKKIEHPDANVLALFAGKDLPWTRRFQVQQHLANCPACEGQVKAIRSACQELRREAESETLTSFEAIADWSRLEREMVGNITVGVAAARCIDHVHKSRKLWVPCAFGAALVVVFTLGWTTHIPGEQTQHLFTSLRSWLAGEADQGTGTILRSSPSGIAVRSQGTTLTMMHPRSATVSMSGTSSVEARFVDESTGLVTITSVYGQ